MNLPPNYMKCDQGTNEWFSYRIGCVTASRAKDAVAFMQKNGKERTKGQETASRAKYKLQLAFERLFDKASTNFVSLPMLEGTRTEPRARIAYQILSGEDVYPIGVVLHPTINWFAASPDGLIGDNGLLELKCPLFHTHMEYIWKGVIPSEYREQCIAQMACCADREYVQFASYCEMMPTERAQTFIAPKFYRDQAQKEIEELERGVSDFLGEVELLTAELRRKLGDNPSETEEGDLTGVLGQSIALVKSRKQQKQEKEEVDMREIGEEIVL